MMDEFICWPKPYFLLSATCDEILSWMIESWMEIHLVRATTRNIGLLQGMMSDGWVHTVTAVGN